MRTRPIFVPLLSRTGRPGEALEGGQTAQRAGGYRLSSHHEGHLARGGLRRSRIKGPRYVLVARCFARQDPAILLDASKLDPSLILFVVRAWSVPLTKGYHSGAEAAVLQLSNDTKTGGQVSRIGEK